MPLDLPDLPVRSALPALAEALTSRGAAVLVAPPGTGKTTLVPLVLAGLSSSADLPSFAVAGRIVVAEPRRVAARAAARRMASLLGTQVGGVVGYSVRGDRRVSAETRIEVVTTGVLVRRLQRDPELSGTATVMLDECHERHLDADLALAFLTEVRETLRPDLKLIATSATAATERLSDLLSAPVVTATAPMFPVEIRWTPPGSGRLLDHIATVVRGVTAPGDVLVFLPGVREITTVAGLLRGLDADVIPLHGRQSAADQDAALRPGPRRRIVLATAVAESSLTVPGVRVVVDAGLSRVPRMDHSRGLGALVTVPVSRASAEQRAGRAGREAPGVVFRCWSEAQHHRLPAHPEPEIATADLTSFALDLALWGHPTGAGMALPDQPPPGALQSAMTTLHDLGAVAEDGRPTSRGHALARAGIHPRLARALLDGAPLVGRRRAAEIVAVLDENRTAGDDLLAAWRQSRRDNTPTWRTEVRRLTSAIPPTPAPVASEAGGGQGGAGASEAGGAMADDVAAGLVVGLAFPERVARVREPGGRTYLMAGGTAADLAVGSPLAGAAWLVVAAADRDAGARSARIRSAVPIDEVTAREAAATLRSSATEIAWVDGDVVARSVDRLGAIVLTERRLDRPDPAKLRAALLDGLRKDGLGLLTWSRTATDLRERLAFARAALGDPWPAVDDESLLTAAEHWLGPDLTRARRRADLARIDVATALRRLLPWSVAGRLDDVAPERLPVPSGSRVRVSYADPAAPVLAVKLQETFGWRDAPRLADGRIPVLLHLLSPAGRPVAVTADLASFWASGYQQVRAELRGRYPRHPWPEDPTTAAPTARTNRPHRR
ncbi:ATP-dependent helicase HrpB [Actinoplanes sp. NPDC051470]|uniref:ATP-dependent helicase HrpB n=1 Tax=Actinoplanes sp. NPDC051470 TaxID=3157224 RepID=UPI003446789C